MAASPSALFLAASQDTSNIIIVLFESLSILSMYHIAEKCPHTSKDRSGDRFYFLKYGQPHWHTFGCAHYRRRFIDLEIELAGIAVFPLLLAKFLQM